MKYDYILVGFADFEQRGGLLRIDPNYTDSIGAAIGNHWGLTPMNREGTLYQERNSFRQIQATIDRSIGFIFLDYLPEPEPPVWKLRFFVHCNGWKEGGYTNAHYFPDRDEAMTWLTNHKPGEVSLVSLERVSMEYFLDDWTGGEL